MPFKSIVGLIALTCILVNQLQASQYKSLESLVNDAYQQYLADATDPSNFYGAYLRETKTYSPGSLNQQPATSISASFFSDMNHSASVRYKQYHSQWLSPGQIPDYITSWTQSTWVPNIATIQTNFSTERVHYESALDIRFEFDIQDQSTIVSSISKSGLVNNGYFRLREFMKTVPSDDTFDDFVFFHTENNIDYYVGAFRINGDNQLPSIFNLEESDFTLWLYQISYLESGPRQVFSGVIQNSVLEATEDWQLNNFLNDPKLSQIGRNHFKAREIDLTYHSEFFSLKSNRQIPRGTRFLNIPLKARIFESLQKDISEDKDINIKYIIEHLKSLLLDENSSNALVRNSKWGYYRHSRLIDIEERNFDFRDLILRPDPELLINAGVTDKNDLMHHILHATNILHSREMLLPRWREIPDLIQSSGILELIFEDIINAFPELDPFPDIMPFVESYRENLGTFTSAD